MSSVILYVATSVDGYIANKEGGVSWLEPFDHSGEDYGYNAFYRRLGAIIMGGTTYRQVLGFGEWPYQGVTSYIVTHRGLDRPPAKAIRSFEGDVGELVRQVRQESDRDIWLVGGADLVAQFEERQLIDEYILSVMPLILGDGIPLFRRTGVQSRLELVVSQSYPSGVVQLQYRRTA